MQYKEELYKFHVIGTSYEKADVDTRGQFAFFDSYIDEFIERAKTIGVKNFFILSTCNRTEIYFFGDNSAEMQRIYCEQVNGKLDLFKEITFVKDGKEAINHMFRVSTGIESQILGDFEVLYQMRKAFRNFKEKGTANAYMERIMDTAIQISKQIKNETSLSDGATSVSYAAVQYILQNVENFNQKNIVLFGTGKIGRNTCENLVKHSDNNHITVINRTEEKAKALSEKLHLTTRKMEELPEVLENTDILFVATGAPYPTVSKDLIPDGKEMTVVDLSIPENVSKGVAELDNVKVVNVDELSKVINKTFESRKSEIPKVETIIRLKMWEFEDWLDARKYVPAIEAFKERMKFLKLHEKKQLLKKDVALNEINPLTDRLIQKMTNQFASHIMEHPDTANETVELMNKMFHLDLED